MDRLIKDPAAGQFYTYLHGFYVKCPLSFPPFSEYIVAVLISCSSNPLTFPSIPGASYALQVREPTDSGASGDLQQQHLSQHNPQNSKLDWSAWNRPLPMETATAQGGASARAGFNPADQGRAKPQEDNEHRLWGEPSEVTDPHYWFFL